MNLVILRICNIDIEIDKRQADLTKKSENLIIEGRLSAYFIEADLKIWLTAPFDVRAQRICNESQKQRTLLNVRLEYVKKVKL